MTPDTPIRAGVAVTDGQGNLTVTFVPAFPTEGLVFTVVPVAATPNTGGFNVPQVTLTATGASAVVYIGNDQSSGVNGNAMLGWYAVGF